MLFLLSFNLSGNCLGIQSQYNGFADITFLISPELLDSKNISQLEKEPKDQSTGGFHKEDNPPRIESQEKAKKKDKSTSESEQKKETPLKSYDQLKSVLEEVDMMVSGWI